MATAEERLSRLEGGYEHLATKADVGGLSGELKSIVYQIEARLIRWMVGVLVGSIAGASSIALLVQRLTD